MARNVIAPEKNLAAVEEVFTAAAWDYKESLERMRPRLLEWGKLTLEICRELYYARRFLTGQTGQYKDPTAGDYLEHTWAGYCGELGIDIRAANRRAKLYVPAGESETGEEYFLEAGRGPALPPPPSYTEKERERRIARVMNGGGRPEGWSKEEEKIVRERLRDKRFEEIAAIYLEQKHRAPGRDYFQEILVKTKTLKQFRLKTPEQTRAQLVMFDAIDGYLRAFPDKESLLAAAANLAAQIHGAANYLVQRYIAAESGKEG
jgi:hypothetical protein